MSITTQDIGVRCVDISKCMQSITVGTHTYVFSRADKIGSALRVAANIQGLETVTNNQLMLIATRLGIKPNEAIDTIVPLQEKFGWIDPKRDSSGNLTRIEENIPSVSDCFKAGGEGFLNLNPEQIEKSGIEALEITSYSPVLAQDLMSNFDLKNEGFNKMVGVCKSANLLDSYQEKRNKIIFSPYLWDIKDMNSLKFINSMDYQERISLSSLGNEISRFQGYPINVLEKKSFYDKKVMGASQRCGLFTRSSIELPGKGRNDFIFMPSGKLNIDEEGSKRNDVFNKVKNLITCMRQGQYFADFTKIRYPIIILENLLHDGYIGKTPHSEIKHQYNLIEIDGLARAEEVSNGRYRLHLNRTKLNEQIIRCAISILKEPKCKEEMKLDNLNDIIGAGGRITVPEQNRASSKKHFDIDPALKEVMEVLRGERHDLW